MVAAIKFDHKEAFCLMLYVSKDGMESEQLWNSRDGVTPFVISNRDKTKKMQHTNFSGDKRLINHVPSVGDRIFVDMPRERMLELQMERVERDWDEGEFKMSDHPMLGKLGKVGAAEALTDNAWQVGCPEIIVVSLEWLDDYAGPDVKKQLLYSMPSRFA